VLAPLTQSGEPLFIVLNGADHEVEAIAPDWPGAESWQPVLDTSNRERPDKLRVGEAWTTPARCVLAFTGEP
jgi:hypothetical protein